jgi:hypothetical protein
MVGGRTDMNDGAAAQPNRLCLYMIDSNNNNKQRLEHRREQLE